MFFLPFPNAYLQQVNLMYKYDLLTQEMLYREILKIIDRQSRNLYYRSSLSNSLSFPFEEYGICENLAYSEFKLQSQNNLGLSLPWPPSNNVTWAKLLNFSKPWVLQLQNEENNITFLGLPCVSNGIIVKDLAQCLTPVKCSVKVSSNKYFIAQDNENGII